MDVRFYRRSFPRFWGDETEQSKSAKQSGAVPFPQCVMAEGELPVRS